MAVTTTDGLVLIGRVTGAHGIRGEIKIYPYSGEPENFLRYRRVLLAPAHAPAPTAYGVVQARVQKDRVVVLLDACSDRDAAERLAQAAVYVQVEDLPKPGPDEFYLRDLIGREMKTVEGAVIGQIRAVLPGSQDIAQVEQDGKEHLIPLVPEFIAAVTDEAVVVHLPPGLLEINA